MLIPSCKLKEEDLGGSFDSLTIYVSSCCVTACVDLLVTHANKYVSIEYRVTNLLLGSPWYTLEENIIDSHPAHEA